MALLGVAMRCCGQTATGVGVVRLFERAVPRLRHNRADKTIASAGQGLDPSLAPWFRAEYSPEGRDLHSMVALVDRLAGPSGFDQLILRDQCAGPLDQRPQQQDRPFSQGHGLAAAEQKIAPRIQPKWSQRNVRHSGRFLTFFRNFS